MLQILGQLPNLRLWLGIRSARLSLEKIVANILERLALSVLEATLWPWVGRGMATVSELLEFTSVLALDGSSLDKLSKDPVLATTLERPSSLVTMAGPWLSAAIWTKTLDPSTYTSTVMFLRNGFSAEIRSKAEVEVIKPVGRCPCLLAPTLLRLAPQDHLVDTLESMSGLATGGCSEERTLKTGIDLDILSVSMVMAVPLRSVP